MLAKLSSIVLTSCFLLGCSNASENPQVNVSDVGQNANPTDSPESLDFFDVQRYNSSELNEFANAFEALEVKLDEFDEVYSWALGLDDAAFVSEVRKKGSAARILIGFDYGKNKDPYLGFLVTFVGEDWLFMEKLQIRTNDQTLEFELVDVARDVTGSALVAEVGSTMPISGEEAELLFQLSSDANAKARLVGDSLNLEWNLTDHEKENIVPGINAYRHVVFTEYPRLVN